MSGSEHVLERRATMLASRMATQVSTLRQALVPKGQRIPFTEQMSRPDALAWWTQHIGDKYGAKALSQLDPMSQLELRQALGMAGDQSPTAPTDAAMGVGDG